MDNVSVTQWSGVSCFSLANTTSEEIIHFIACYLIVFQFGYNTPYTASDEPFSRLVWAKHVCAGY